MKLSALFHRCISIPYVRVENSADYAIERIGDTLYIYFECSNGEIDWLNNFDFPSAPYKRMKGDTWRAHRGFLRVFKSVEPYIAHHVSDLSIKSIVTVGYSHGAAIATLCHEYVWYNRPDIRAQIQGYAFASPRVVWGYLPYSLAKRWENHMVIRNINDIVTHVPPRILGYTHVGKILEIGKKGKYSATNAHRPENILAELLEYEHHQNKINGH